MKRRWCQLNECMKKLLILIVTLLAFSNLSAQTYRVGDYYNVDGKEGVVFEVTADGLHGKIIAITQPAEKMTWRKAMEWGDQLEGGWYMPSLEEMQILLDVHSVVAAKLREFGVKSPYWCWSTTEFGADFAWAISVRTDSRGGFYKGNRFNVCAVSKF